MCFDLRLLFQLSQGYPSYPWTQLADWTNGFTESLPSTSASPSLPPPLPAAPAPAPLTGRRKLQTAAGWFNEEDPAPQTMMLVTIVVPQVSHETFWNARNARPMAALSVSLS